jgi:hypothetical protein
LINGKKYYYNFKDKRWKLCKRATVAKTENETSPAAPETPATPAPPVADGDVAMANKMRTIEASLRGLVNQFN